MLIHFLVVFVDDIDTKDDTFIADVKGVGASNELAHLILVFEAKVAAIQRSSWEIINDHAFHHSWRMTRLQPL
jgi:hypothetical protein